MNKSGKFISIYLVQNRFINVMFKILIPVTVSIFIHILFLTSISYREHNLLIQYQDMKIYIPITLHFSQTAYEGKIQFSY